MAPLGVRYNVGAMTRSDVQLMLDVKAGDDASFNLLLQKYRTPLINFLYRMVRDTATAEDLAQEVFLRVYRARKQYSPSAKFTTWLFRIATNLALNSVRDNRHRQMDVSIDAPVEEDEAPLQLPTREMRIDEHMIERDRADFIRQAIASLPEKQRVAVLLHKYEEMDYAEIAKILECSESALKSLLFRAYETLRVQLAPLVVPADGASRRGRTAIMKKCEEVSKQLVAYLDRRANSAERQEVEEHLAACRACHERAEGFRKLWGVLDEVPLVEPSLSFDARIRARIAEEPRPRWFRWLVPQPRLAFSMALLLALSVWMARLAARGESGGDASSRISKRSRIWASWRITTC